MISEIIPVSYRMTFSFDPPRMKWARSVDSATIENVNRVERKSKKNVINLIYSDFMNAARRQAITAPRSIFGRTIKSRDFILSSKLT